MAINSKLAAAKKAVKPKSKKTWADNQNPPQSKSYKSAADALVKAKPVGWRWTEAGAARLVKKTSVKPSTADIEKYKDKVFTKGGVEHRYLYSEARADKSDNSQKTKLKTGGRTKLVIPTNQNPPQSKSYKEETDKTVAAKPVGWRWTSYGAHKLGKNDEVKPSADDIEQYKNKTFKLRGVSVRYLYPERRIDKSDTSRRNKFAAGGQAAPQSGSYQEARDKQVHAKPIGYRFTDARARRLGESPYEKPTAEQIEKYKDKGVYWENRKDKSDRNYTRKFEEGGMEHEEYDEYLESEENDSEKEVVEINPVGLAEGEQLRVLWVQVTVYDYENGDDLEISSWSHPEHKGKTLQSFEVIPFLEDELYLSDNLSDYIIMDNTILFDQLVDKDMSAASESEIELWRKGELKLYNAHYNIGFDAIKERTLTEEELSAITGIGVYRVGGVTQSAPQSQSYTEESDKMYKAKPVGWRFKTIFARRKGIDPYRKPTLEEIEKWKDKGVYYEIRFDKSDKNLKRKFAAGGQAASEHVSECVKDVVIYPPHKGSYSKKWILQATPLGMTAYEVEKKLQQSDFDLTGIELDSEHSRFFAEGSKSEVDRLGDFLVKKMARGGQAAPQSGSYQEARDKQVHAKPIGYRFTDARARRLGESPYEKPTAEQIEKYKDKGVYWENRKDKSDRNYTRKFEEGGMGDEEYARGGSPKIANRDSKGYTENRYDFRGTNLEGKTLTNGDYVVLSYGYYPIWFYSNATGKWYGNANGFSHTNKVQISQSRPTYNAEMLQKSALEDIMHRSSLGTLYEEEKVDDNEPNV
jgi:hypothetical protein